MWICSHRQEEENTRMDGTSLPFTISNMPSPLFIPYYKHRKVDVVVSMGQTCREKMRQSRNIGITCLIYRKLRFLFLVGAPSKVYLVA
jgi:hypothetical protein